MTNLNRRLSCALLALAFASCAKDPIRIGWNTPAAKIALDPTIPGCGLPGHCDEYARALQDRLTQAGIPCNRVGFHYTLAPENRGSRRYNKGARDDAHAGVVYNDNGRYYWKDNQRRWPEWIHDGTPDSVANTLATDYTNLEIESMEHTDF